jgi:hypothetical protein
MLGAAHRRLDELVLFDRPRQDRAKRVELAVDGARRSASLAPRSSVGAGLRKPFGRYVGFACVSGHFLSLAAHWAEVRIQSICEPISGTYKLRLDQIRHFSRHRLLATMLIYRDEHDKAATQRTLADVVASTLTTP